MTSDNVIDYIMDMDLVGGVTDEELEQKLKNARTVIDLIDNEQREKAANIKLYCKLFIEANAILTESNIDQFTNRAFEALKELQTLSRKKMKLKQFLDENKEGRKNVK